MNFPNQTDNDRKEVIHILSLYHRLKLCQLIRCFPSISEDTMLSMLRRLGKQGRLCIRDSLVISLPENKPTEGMEEVFDVLLDFFPEVSYHTPGEYPVTLTFFAKEEVYDVMWLPRGKELITIHAQSQQLQSSNGNHLLVVLANAEQLEMASKMKAVTAFCLVTDGIVQYFKKR